MARTRRAKTKTLQAQRLKSALFSFTSDSHIGHAILVLISTFFFITLAPFWGLSIAGVLSLICGITAYFNPLAAVLLSLLIALPAFAFQSSALAWLYILFIFLTVLLLFVLENYTTESLREFVDDYITGRWYVIPILQLAISTPLTILGNFGFLTYVVLACGALYLGSKRSAMISIPSVFFILLLGVFFQFSNTALLPHLDFEGYSHSESLLRATNDEPAFGELAATALDSTLGLLNPEAAESALKTFPSITYNLVHLFTVDSAIIQISFWAIALFLVGYLPPRISNQFSEPISVLALLIVPLSTVGISLLYSTIAINPLPFAYVLLSAVFVMALNYAGVSLSKERNLKLSTRQKKFGKFGIEDLGASMGPQSLDDVGGYDDVKQELKDAIVVPLKNKEISLTYGIRPSSGVLLFGPPGTGKTMIMSALSKELDIGFYYVKCSDILSSWHGESEKNISELFAVARENAPCILFFDEIESLAKARDKYHGDDVSPRVLSVMLAEMSGLVKDLSRPVIVVGATNTPEQLDPAMMRPGRLDKIIYMRLPTKDERKEILKVSCQSIPKNAIEYDSIDFDNLAKITERFSGADLANMVNESLREAARAAKQTDRVTPVTYELLVSMAKRLKPSTALKALSRYEKFKLDFERRSIVKESEDKKPDISFDDVIGLEGAIKALREAVEIPLLHEDLLKKYNLRPTKGVLLFGPPGCGKSMLMRAASQELGATFLSVSGAEIYERGSVYAQEILHDTFLRAREQAPAIVFIDEIESLAPSRKTVSSSVLTQLLQELDGVSELKKVVVVGATNKPAWIDSALLRPGRFDKLLYVSAPGPKAREGIFRSNLGSINKDLDFATFAQKSAGFSGADIVSVCQEAKMHLVRSKIAGKEGRLTNDILDTILASRRASITKDDLAEYKRFLIEYGERK